MKNFKFYFIYSNYFIHKSEIILFIILNYNIHYTLIYKLDYMHNLF